MGFSDFQREVYALGEAPVFTTNGAALEGLAKEKLNAKAYNYIAGSASQSRTNAANKAAFDDWRIVPRMLHDASERETGITLFGVDVPSPFLIAPIGVQGIAHPDGEEAVARAAADLEVPFILSTAATRTIEQVAAASGDNLRFFQLYWPANDEVTLSLLKRAKDNGYHALVVTLDTFTLGFRPSDLDQAYLPFLQAVGSQIGLSDPVFMRSQEREPLPDGSTKGLSEDEVQELAMAWLAEAFSGRFRTWDDLAFLRKSWKGPIILKGIQRVEDARLAIKHKMDGIIVSNHGGRQVDGARASLDALAAIAADRQVRRSGLTVLFDSGIRSGSDAIKALALGAKAVCIGRPFMYGLALAGEEGVTHVLRSLLADFEVTMALAGRRTIAELDRGMLERVGAPPPTGFFGRILAKL